MLTSLNHITLATDNLTESIEFYSDLGFTPHVRWDGGAYLSLNEFWLCLSKGNVDPKNDYSHLAFSVENEKFEKVRSLIKTKGIAEWQENTSEGKSIYFLDPSGHQLEVHIGGLKSRLTELRKKPYNGLVWLNNEM